MNNIEQLALALQTGFLRTATTKEAAALLRQQDALLRQALEALDSGIALDDGSIDTDYLDAITAIKEHLK